MYRPGWFIEYSPKEQKIFDILYKTIEQKFAQYGYQHIHTPAVESVDVLKKWWDEVSKQIFGLYGLAQWAEDAKNYALHFDLTVPFARYVLDRQNELAFPFKRYQIQPVWRGERSQRGRYKEFRQADIDVIWKTKDDKGYNAVYDADCIIALSKSINSASSQLGLNISSKFHVNNKLFTLALIDLIAGIDRPALFKLFDSYHKLSKEKFKEELSKLEIKWAHIDILTSLYGKSIEQFRAFAASSSAAQNALDQLEQVTKKLDFENINYIIDPFIVRGLDYYTGTVFETFIDDRKDLGSICSGWAYANLTEFLDERQSFSWVGWSIGLSRLMSVLLEEYNIAETFSPEEESYLVIHEEGKTQQAQDIVTKLHSKHKIAEMYPLVDKLDKQFKYAEKKGISYIVQIFDTGVKCKKLGEDWNDFDNL